LGRLVAVLVVLVISWLTAPPPVAAQQTAINSTIAQGTNYETDLFVVKGNDPGPVVLIVGGIHGNEAAGVKAAKQIKDLHIKRGTLLVLPEANKNAVEMEKRCVPGEWDLNRSFPASSRDKPSNPLSQAIYSLLADYSVDWVLDLHEGINYNRVSDSVGQSVIYYERGNTGEYARSIVNTLNQDISSSTRKFSLLKNPVQGSLARSAAEYEECNAMIIETCMKDKLATRIDYHVEAVKVVLKKLNML
jgi:predicted deacylase